MTAKRMVRAAMTQTANAYREMPQTVAELGKLEGKLADVARANVEHHVALMREAKRQGAQAIGFGELFPGPYFALDTNPLWLGLAEDAETGPTVSAIRDAAKEHGLIVVAPIYEQGRDGKRFNTAVVIDETGAILGKFRKTHIPYGKNEQGSFHENFYYERSDGKNDVATAPTGANVSQNPFFPVFQTSIGKIGVAICYDRHFEGVVWSLAKEGAELIFSPAVTFGSKSQRMWQLEFQVDAARHNVFIGGSNRKGEETPWGQPFFGESHFAGPNGVAPNLSQHPKLIVSDLDLGELAAGDLAGWNLPRDIRHDIYSKRG